MSTLLPPFQFRCHFFFLSFFCLNAMTYSTMLNKSGESKHPHLVPEVKRNTSSFCPLSIMLAVGLSYMAFITLRYVPSIPTLLRVFIKNGCWILSNAISTSIDMIKGFLPFILFMWCITFIDLQILYQPCIPGINPTSSCCITF
uniref:Uncharacterized protein n=1 Tax=Molossus molossus TaxID=27622 RepID=A0A7J8E2H1_MOLMO|nr:hypothetical protein HJG59_009038 [Molossus molossus]